MNSQKLTGIYNLSPLEAFGGSAVSGKISHLTDAEWKSEDGAAFNIKVNGQSDPDVRITGTGSKAGAERTRKLNYINDNTGNTGIVYLTDTTSSAKNAGTTADNGGY
jgi:hypothetical protein